MLLMNFFRKLGARCPCAFAALSLAQLLRCRNGEQRPRTATYEDKGQTPAPSVGLPHKPFPMLMPHSDVNAPCGDDVAGSVRDPHLASCHPFSITVSPLIFPGSCQTWRVGCASSSPAGTSPDCCAREQGRRWTLCFLIHQEARWGHPPDPDALGRLSTCRFLPKKLGHRAPRGTARWTRDPQPRETGGQRAHQAKLPAPLWPMCRWSIRSWQLRSQ